MPFLADSEQAIVTEHVEFLSGSYLLQGELAYPEIGSATGAIVIAGPHPLLGGNMRNNVVRCVGDGLAKKGMLTLRFDYRGVGRSQGPKVDVAQHLAEFWKTSHAPAEMDFWHDVQAAFDFLHQSASGIPVALVGYSFGCVLLPYIEPRKDLSALVLIAPTVGKHNYDSYRSTYNPLLVVASEDDFATEMPYLEAWLSTLSMPWHLEKKRCDNHFFRGHEDWLVETIFRYLDRHGK